MSSAVPIPAKHFRIVSKWFLLLLTCMLSQGCSTYYVWRGDSDFDVFHEPSSPSNLRVYSVASKHDFLIVYDEISPWHKLPVRRAYLASKNEWKIRHNSRPSFVKLQLTNSLPNLPVFQMTDSLPPLFNAREFVVERSDKSVEIFESGKVEALAELPTYPSGIGNTKRILLTPLTLAADVTILGGYAIITGNLR